ncbi:flagellar motor switch protein FliM [Iodidimonas muriae]|uniref:Flagellar motor switch protein FliM n=1 Tax=Iodidimonas muriae TaxID=261467 RepID=A0ABQ2LFH8_9PROT|nr:FliM/FliN family flagellar motor switch protein [Iodidimonas muriae]GER08601.1 flagellar motor switch protein FliM [Kordiimonadales bacterium JCM 17843]GGO15475.1 flagellar motor switch protein FliM [Iodidimonas muriae]
MSNNGDATEGATDEANLGQAYAAAVNVDLSKNQLDQSDIDRLMSDEPSAHDSPQSVMQKIANSTIVNYERLPMLDVVFERFVRLFAERLRQLMSANLEISIEQVSAIRFGDFIDQLPLPCLVSIIDAVEWEDKCIAVMDQRLVYTAVEILLGGREVLGSDNLEIRSLTSIERSLVLRLMRIFSSTLSESFAPVSEIQFTPDRLETNPQLAMITRATSASIHARFSLDIEGRPGYLDLVMPYSMLEPVRALLLQMFMGESFGRDNGWKNHFRDQLQRTEIQLDGVLSELTLPLAEALQWKPGTFIELHKDLQGRADLYSDDVCLLSGQIGQSKGRIAIQIDESIFDTAKEKEEEKA